MTLTLIDDHRLLELIEPSGGSMAGYATTCSWWWRLAVALSHPQHGSLSRRADALDPMGQRALQATIGRLRDHLVVLDLGELIPAMAVLRQDLALNLLAAEAVVAAEVLQATIEVAVPSPLVEEGAAHRGLTYRVAGLG